MSATKARTGMKPRSVRYMTKAVGEGHTLAHADGRTRVHRLVLFEAIGPGRHKCHWCDTVVEWNGSPNLIADHVDGDTWNNDPSNLVPSCSRCNSSRRAARSTHCKNGHEWNEANTYWRWTDASHAKKSRQCRACARDRKKAIAEREQMARPKRIGLRISLRGLTVGDVRDFVEQTRGLDASTSVLPTFDAPSSVSGEGMAS